MSEAYERERQNNARLDELSSKVSALRGVTVDIYDQASSHSLIENTVRARWLLDCFSSASRLSEPDGVVRGNTQGLGLTMDTIERYLLDDGHTDEGLGRTTDTNGCERKQGRDIEVGGYHNSGDAGVVLRGEAAVWLVNKV